MRLIKQSPEKLDEIANSIKEELQCSVGYCPVHGHKVPAKLRHEKSSYRQLYGFRNLCVLGSSISISISGMNTPNTNDRSFMNGLGISASIQNIDIFADFVSLTESEMATVPSWRRQLTRSLSGETQTQNGLRGASGFLPSNLISLQYQDNGKVGHPLCHLDLSMRRMDEMYSATFHDFLREECNRPLIATHIRRMFQDFSFLEIAKGITWLTSAWSASAAGELIGFLTEEWSPELTGLLVRTIIILPVHSLIFHGELGNFIKNSNCISSATSLPDLLADRENVKRYNCRQPAHLR